MFPLVLNLLSNIKGQTCPQKLEMKTIFKASPSWNGFLEDFITYVAWSEQPVLFPSPSGGNLYSPCLVLQAPCLNGQFLCGLVEFFCVLGTQDKSSICVWYFYLPSFDVILLVDMNLYYTDIMYILNANDLLLYNFTHKTIHTHKLYLHRILKKEVSNLKSYWVN